MDVQIACTCPPKAGGEPRHDSDTVTLHEPILPVVRRALIYDLGLLPDDATAGDRLAMLSEGYILRCIDAWTLWGDVEDEKGRTKLGPLPPSRDNIRLRILGNDRAFDVLAKAADDLYSEAVLLPLLLWASSSLSDGPTNGSTSPAKNGATHPRKRSRPSSTSTIPMVVTGPMLASSGGDSSS